MILKRFLFGILLSSSFFSAQNIDLYLSLLDEGRVLEVREALPELRSRFPDNDGVHFLHGMTTTNGDSSIQRFQGLIRKYPRSQYADNAAVKIGEYFFARGLYTQASVQFRSVLQYYPNSEHLQRTMDLMVNSYQATGEDDSAKVYLRWAKRYYPGLNYEQYGYKDLDLRTKDLKLVRLEPGMIERDKKTGKIITRPKPWVVQVGAFRKYDNARRLKEQIMTGGLPVQIDEVSSHGMRLHAVRIVRFVDKKQAEEVGKRIKKEFGLNYRVLNRPK